MPDRAMSNVVAFPVRERITPLALTREGFAALDARLDTDACELVLYDFDRAGSAIEVAEGRGVLGYLCAVDRTFYNQVIELAGELGRDPVRLIEVCMAYAKTVRGT
jgi:hypothetical protein